MTRLQTRRIDDEVVLILRDDHLIAGSICWDGKQWHVEILWGGPSGDHKYAAPSFDAALAFVAGVEQTFNRFDERARAFYAHERLTG